MIDEKRRKAAQENFAGYLREGMVRREKNEIAEKMYLRNAELSLQVAQELSESSLKPYMWVIVCAYYSMFYMANAVLLHMGYKMGEKIVHKVTSDALIVLVVDRLKKEMIENYESLQEDALEIASVRADELVENFSLERAKRSKFQYNMLEQTKENKAKTSLKRASEFVFEMKKLLG
jgi:uncharacterized protein (UPF0332 family)